MRLKTYFDIKWLALAVALVAIVILLIHIPQKFMLSEIQEGSFDTFRHIVAYGAITFLLILSVKSSLSLYSALLILFALLVIGIVDEIAQPLVSRQASLDDLMANVIGIVAVLLFSIVGKSRFEKIKTESVSKLCFTATVAFVAGILAVPVTFISLSILQGPILQQQ
jgi:glycopeptide antibiotics resistance protein